MKIDNGMMEPVKIFAFKTKKAPLDSDLEGKCKSIKENWGENRSSTVAMRLIER